MLVTDKREYLRSAGCWIVLIKILTCSRPNGHKRTLSDADGHRTRPCVGWADIDTRGRLCRRTSQSPLEAATVTVGNTRHGDSATTEEERLLGLVPRRTPHVDRVRSGRVEWRPQGHHLTSTEGAKVVTVVSVHNRRLKETPSTGGRAVPLPGSISLIIWQLQSGGTEAETYVQSSSCPQKNSVSWPKSSRSSPSWYLHSLSPRRTHVS